MFSCLDIVVAGRSKVQQATVAYMAQMLAGGKWNVRFSLLLSIVLPTLKVSPSVQNKTKRKAKKKCVQNACACACVRAACV